MTEQPSKPRTPRAKSEGPRAYVLTDTTGKQFIVQLNDVRVAGDKDLQRALYGSDLPAGVVSEK